MPTLFDKDPYRFYAFSNRPGERPEVVVDRGECSATLRLLPVEAVQNYGFTIREMRIVEAAVREREKELLTAYGQCFKTGS